MRVLLLLLLLVLSAWAEAPPIISRAQWGSKPQPLGEELRQVPRRILIHHAGVVWKDGTDPYASIRTLQHWGQKEKGWPDLPYHYLIAPAGQIFEGRDWHYRPESNTSYDLNGVLNVELWGNFEEQPVPPAQLRSLVSLLVHLCREHSLAPAVIQGHRDAAPGQTVCPGQNLYEYLQSGELVRQIEALLHNGSPASDGNLAATPTAHSGLMSISTVLHKLQKHETYEVRQGFTQNSGLIDSSREVEYHGHAADSCQLREVSFKNGLVLRDVAGQPGWRGQ